MPERTAILLIPLLPFAGFLLTGLFGRKYIRRFSGPLATILLGISAVLACICGAQYFFPGGHIAQSYQPITRTLVNWLPFTEELSIHAGILLDPLSVMMIVMVTFISLMVHMYSIGYMRGEARYPVFFSFLQLFTFSMLGLVLSSNIFEIYIFWELVGLSSYLLIGFYYDRPSAVAAAKKAFVVTRFADLGFLVGILILGFTAHSLDFSTLIATLSSNHYTQTFLGISVLTWGLSLVFIGGAGKSAMFPLHIWLPDAMEGPTPVSALIHAATMVVAGVFLVARLFPVFALSGSHAQDLVAWTGIFSAFFAAVIACTQTDIKRVLAYSTMSQIGYMMFALGVSGYGPDGAGYTAGLFHLFTHAFFKSLLFLCAGIIIHAVHSNDMKKMGGLRKVMPLTHVLFLIACLAISGIPPFAGFFSKEGILSAAEHSNTAIYIIGVLTSGLTAFYMFRLYFSIFWRDNPDTALHAKVDHPDGLLSMRIPVILLATGSLFAGFIPFGRFVSSDGNPLPLHISFSASLVPVLIGLAGIFAAAFLYRSKNNRPQELAIALGGIYETAKHTFYINEIYLFVTKKIIFNAVGRPAAWFDRHVVDGLMNRIASITAWFSRSIKGWQSGEVQSYALYFFAGLMGLAVLCIYFFA